MNLLHDLLDITARRAPEAEALRFRGTGVSYAALRQRTLDLAASLAALGVRRGDRLAICMQNRPEVVELAIAASRLGAIFVPVSPMLKVRQLEHLLNDSGATLLAASQGATHALDELLRASPTVRTLLLCDAGQPPSLPAHVQTVSYEQVASRALRGQDACAATGAIADDAAALLYTSGSTGRPKGVIVSHRNFVSGALSVSQYQRNTAADRILAALPLSFDYGFSQVTVAFAVGACAVLTNFALPAALLQEAQAERITGLAGVPTMWMHLAAMEWPTPVVRTLRYVTNSGGAMPAAVLARLRAALPDTQVFCMYGLTEAFRSTYLDPAELDRRPGSIGKAIPGQEVFVLRADGSECAPGEVGELVHRGSLVTLGYWNDPVQTAHRFRTLPPKLAQIPRSEWAVWSGDLARTDADGFLYFISRADHLIKSSGYRISPTEVEEVVAEVPGVVESAAVGLADESLGQRVAVGIVAAAGREDLAEAVRQHCRVQLPSYMVPAEIHMVAALPRNANGKCDRGALASQLAGLPPVTPRVREA